MRAPASRHVPLRRCTLCRASLPQAELIRLVRAPEPGAGTVGVAQDARPQGESLNAGTGAVRVQAAQDTVRLDIRRRLGGRGTWVCRNCAAKAAAGQGEKRLRQAFSAQAPLVKSLLERALVDLPERRLVASGEQDGGVNV